MTPKKCYSSTWKAVKLANRNLSLSSEATRARSVRVNYEKCPTLNVVAVSMPKGGHLMHMSVAREMTQEPATIVVVQLKF